MVGGTLLNTFIQKKSIEVCCRGDVGRQLCPGRGGDPGQHCVSSVGDVSRGPKLTHWQGLTLRYWDTQSISGWETATVVWFAAAVMNHDLLVSVSAAYWNVEPHELVAAGLKGQLHHGYSSMQTFHNQRSQPLHCNLQSVLLPIVAIMQNTSLHYTIAFLYVQKFQRMINVGIFFIVFFNFLNSHFVSGLRHSLPFVVLYCPGPRPTHPIQSVSQQCREML